MSLPCHERPALSAGVSNLWVAIARVPATRSATRLVTGLSIAASLCSGPRPSGSDEPIPMSSVDQCPAGIAFLPLLWLPPVTITVGPLATVSQGLAQTGGPNPRTKALPITGQALSSAGGAARGSRLSPRLRGHCPLPLLGATPCGREEGDRRRLSAVDRLYVGLPAPRRRRSAKVPDGRPVRTVARATTVSGDDGRPPVVSRVHGASLRSGARWENPSADVKSLHAGCPPDVPPPSNGACTAQSNLPPSHRGTGSWETASLVRL